MAKWLAIQEGTGFEVLTGQMRLFCADTLCVSVWVLGGFWVGAPPTTPPLVPDLSKQYVICVT